VTMASESEVKAEIAARRAKEDKIGTYRSNSAYLAILRYRR
jgi:hypothetical protein